MQDISFRQGILAQATGAVFPTSLQGVKDAGITAAGVTGAVATIVATTQQSGLGLLSALGADYHIANNRNGVRYSNMTPKQARNIIQLGSMNLKTSGLSADPIGLKGLSPVGKTGAEGIYKGGKAGVIIGTGASVLFGIQAMDDGPGALPKYFAQEVFANYSGLMHSHYFYKEGADTIGKVRSVAGFGVGGRVTATLGAYFGSGIGYDVGASVGGFVGGMIDENLEGTGKFIGALGGALTGAEAGAYLLRGARQGAGMGIRAFSRAGAAIAGGALLYQGVSTAYRGLYATLKTGFQQKRKMRGLDFAGDPSQFYTQRATTMRQRAVQAMNRSHMNARSAFGQEAQLMHTHRDTFSTYRRI